MKDRKLGEWWPMFHWTDVLPKAPVSTSVAAFAAQYKCKSYPGFRRPEGAFTRG